MIDSSKASATHPQEIINQFYLEDQTLARSRDFYTRLLPWSGYSLVNRIAPDADILDVGCGQNLFKQYFPNLIGIDPVTPEADIKVTIQDYQPDRQFDVALCLGGIQGNDASVRQQVAKIHDLLKPRGRIYWRCMPDPPPKLVPEWMSLWSFERHRTLSAQLGFEVIELEWDIVRVAGKEAPRIYAQWQRLN